MYRKLLVSVGTVIALSALSIVAFANSFSETRTEIPTPTVKATEHPAVTYSEAPVPVIETEEPVTDTPEPTVEAATNMEKSRAWDAKESYLLAKLAMAEADCWAALDLIMQDKWDESRGALYFESESKSTWHKDNLKLLFQHGNHIFYTDKED